jgi:hypothetical protein
MKATATLAIGQKRCLDFNLSESIKPGKYNIVAAIDAGDYVALEAVESVIEVK